MKKLILLLTLFCFVLNATENLTRLDKKRIELNKIYSETINGGPTFATVGGDAACDYQIGADTLQDAVDSGLPEIRLATNSTYARVNIFSSVSIIGGYNNCTEAASNTISQNASNSIINGDPILATFNINTANITIALKKITIQNGTIAISKFGINTNLIIQDSIIQNNNNTNFESAGIYMASAGSGSTFLENVRITNNTNDGRGGGIRCINNEVLTIVGDSSVDNNHANNGPGGGIYAELCDVTIIGGSNLTFPTGISNNSTVGLSSNAGGVYIGSSTLTITGGKMVIDNIEYGDLSTPYLFFDNSASPTQSRSGGGIYASNSTVNLTNISMVNNHASSAGGAIAAVNDSQINVMRSTENCWSDISCNFFQGNTADVVSGAFHFTSGADGLIQASTIKGNRADIATVMNVGSATSTVQIESSFIYGNGDSGNGAFADDNVFRVNGAGFNLYQSTVVDNASTSQIIETIGGSTTLANNLIYNPSINATFINITGGTSIFFLCTYVDDTNHSSGSGFTAISQTDYDTAFIDPLNGDFHLSSNSLLIDQCNNPFNFPIKDIDGQSFGEDQEMINGTGLIVVDVGADEVSEFVFKDGFE